MVNLSKSKFDWYRKVLLNIDLIINNGIRRSSKYMNLIILVEGININNNNNATQIAYLVN